jgi:hypothetical protein
VSRAGRGGVTALAAAATTGLVLALVDGAPDPGVAVRSYAAVIGLLAVVSALSWLRRGGRTWRGAGAARATTEPELDMTDPASAAWRELERALRFGALTIGDYKARVQPRVAAVAARRLARRGTSLSEPEAARALLGEGFHLIDPRVPYPPNRLAPGVPVAEIEPLLAALEEL